MKAIQVDVLPEMVDLRLDKALALHPEIQTRSRAAYLIDSGAVTINQKSMKASYSLKATDLVEIVFPEVVSVELKAYDFPLDIVFEDDDLIVINKPSGLVVHPAVGHEQDTLVNALMAHTKNLSMKFGEQRPGIVHRLDKETSGLLVVAKNDFTHENLTQQFKERSTHRIYFAVSVGTAKHLKGVYRSFLARHFTDRKKYASVLGEDKKPLADLENPPENGKWAITHYEVLGRLKGLTYLKLKLETGRTHQIRVHLSENLLPIAGDVLYGADRKIKSLESRYTQDDVRKLSRFLLHAAELGFTHPRTGERLSFKVPWPKEDMEQIKAWGFL